MLQQSMIMILDRLNDARFTNDYLELLHRRL